MPDSELTQVERYLPVPSKLVRHDQGCCQCALAWFRGVDAQESFIDGRWQPPSWLRRRYEWGPARWPIHWCDVPQMERLDCGALAAVAVHLYQMRGHRAVPVQLALRYPVHALQQWSAMWERQGLASDWIAGRLCYHEACGVIHDSELQVWDPTENRWLEPPSSRNDAFGAVVSLRLFPGDEAQEELQWAGIRVRTGVWRSLPFDEQGHLVPG